MKQLVQELRELHTNVGGAIEIIDLLVEESAEVLLKEWSSNLFRMAVEIELRASIMARRGMNANADTARPSAEAEASSEESNAGQ